MSTTVIAKVTKIYGNDGSVVLRLYDDFPLEIDFKEPLMVNIDSLATPLFLNSFTRRGQDKAVAIFDDIDSEYRASFIMGCDIMGSGDSDLEEGEGIVGFRFVDSVSGEKGLVIGYIESDHNPLLEVELGDDTIMVPLAEEFIDNVNIRKKIIKMSLPDGLLDLYRS